MLPTVKLYCIKQGDAEEKGPFTWSQVQNMWHAGSVKVTDKIRRADTFKWHSVAKVRRDLESGGQLTVGKIVLAIVLAFLIILLFWLCSVDVRLTP